MSAHWNRCAFYYIAGFGITLLVVWNRLCKSLNYIDKKPMPQSSEDSSEDTLGGIMGHGRLKGQSTKVTAA